METLVLGAGGMAGHVIALRLKEKGHSVTGFARRELSFCNTIIGDASNVDLIRSLCEQGFDAIINAVGILPNSINGNEYNGIWINACLPHLLADFTKNNSTKVIHLSTDCVFSGNGNGGYDEGSFCDANDLYGRSKALGELNDDKNLTFRMSIVGPDINENGIGLFNWFMKEKNDVNGYTRAIWSGVTTITLADAIAAALAQGLKGLYHLVNNEIISKYELLSMFNQLRIVPLNITRYNDYATNKSMVNTRNDFSFVVPTYVEMVEAMGEWTRKSREFYPQYNLKG